MTAGTSNGADTLHEPAGPSEPGPNPAAPNRSTARDPRVTELVHDLNNLRLALSACLELICRQSNESRILDIATRGLDTVARTDRLIGQLVAIAHGEPAHRATILVVDGDDDVRPVLAELLRSLDYEVVEAADGRAGIAAAEGTPRPDLAIVDDVLRGLGGGEMIAQLRVRHPDLPLVISTGHGELDALEPRWRGLPILHKPFRIAELAKTVAALLAPGLHRPS